MKLLKSKEKPAYLDLPPSYREWWDLGDGYEAHVQIEGEECGISVYSPNSCLSFEIGRYLGLKDEPKDIKFAAKSEGRELYYSVGIDCVILNYTKPDNYMDLLRKIEAIVNEHFKGK